MIQWTPERDELLKRLWAEGHSGSHIASHIAGATRNAVIGRIHRLGLSGRVKKVRLYTPPARRGNRTNGGGTAWKLKVFGRKVLAPKLKPARLPPEPEPLLPPLMLSLMELRADQCRWPFGDPKQPGYGYCGHPRHGNWPYCSGHVRLAYLPADTRRDEEARAA